MKAKDAAPKKIHIKGEVRNATALCGISSNYRFVLFGKHSVPTEKLCKICAKMAENQARFV